MFYVEEAKSLSLIHLPYESLCGIAQFLLPKDIFNFISIHPSFLPLLCRSKQFWSFLNEVHYSKLTDHDNNVCVRSTTNHGGISLNEWESEKNQYLVKSYCNTLDNVRWYAINTTATTSRSSVRRMLVRGGGGRDRPTEESFVYRAPQSREGHVSCVIGNYIVLTGGFVDDTDVYIKHIHHMNDGTTWKAIQLSDNPTIPSDHPHSSNKKWVYGATLTTLDNTRAIMFGGFQSGGYSNETTQVAVLHLEECDDNNTSVTSAPKVWWEVIDQSRVFENSTISCCDTNRAWWSIAGRAYHTSTLLFNRYLLIIGGMQSRGSILNPIILDCQTWTWYIDGITTGCTKSNLNNETETTSTTNIQQMPSERFGCSVIADMEHRNRLVLFGGGDGSDLLRSGRDNTEVWELSLNGCYSSDDVLSSLPWMWNLIHKNQMNTISDDTQRDDGTDERTENPNDLNRVEQLNLGRCHAGYRVSRDTVVLAFGGRPTTNSLLCYNLQDNSFFRTHVHESFLPRARFTFASAYIESKGIIIFHGGYTTQSSSEDLSDTILLDLAPAMNVRESDGRLWLPIYSRAISFAPISETDIPSTEEHDENGLDRLIFMLHSQLLGMNDDEQREISQSILSTLDEAQHNRSIGVVLQLFAYGQLRFDDDGTLFSNSQIFDEEIANELRSLFYDR